MHRNNGVCNVTGPNCYQPLTICRSQYWYGALPVVPLYPGRCSFGMAKPAPATNGSYGNVYGWDATGYDTRHQSIEGFPNFHEFQVGGIVFALHHR